MTNDDILVTIKAIRNEKAEAYKYWQTSKKKIRDSERAMTLAKYNRQIETLDRVITKLLNEGSN